MPDKRRYETSLGAEAQRHIDTYIRDETRREAEHRLRVREALAQLHACEHLPRWLHWAVRQKRIRVLRLAIRVFRVPPIKEYL